MPPHEPPNPGSTEAIEQGCTCPVIDNNHGSGSYKGEGFVTDLTCPLHGDEEDSPDDICV